MFSIDVPNGFSIKIIFFIFENLDAASKWFDVGVQITKISKILSQTSSILSLVSISIIVNFDFGPTISFKT